MKQEILQGHKELIPVHVSREEIKFMDAMQQMATGKKEAVDPHTGLRAYPGLSNLIKDPQIQRWFQGAVYASKHGIKMPPEVSKIGNKIKSQKTPPLPSDREAGVEAMANTGDGNDKKLVMMPVDVVEYLDTLEGTKKKDSKMGLQEFAFFDNVFDLVGSALYEAKNPQREHHMYGEMAGAALMVGGAFLNHLADEAAEERHQEEVRRYEAEKAEQRMRRQARADRWNRGGIKVPVVIPKINRHTAHGLPDPVGGNFKKGGMVLGKVLKGKGHGQEDLIHKDIPENTWIHDAHTVGNWGNGTTEHGQKVIESLEKFAIKKLLTPEVKERFKAQIKEKPLRKVPCAVANGERETPPIIVAALGGGSNDRGANILRDMTESLRVHKISKGHKLPPEAPDIIHHYKRAAHKHGMEV